ncbi:hypothetical protein KIN20_013481 [Parelaphostrongylus tenuis]|uniref:CAF17 C-terminal domain-containing protein n=1 Tax=Parelaphostrongylus tenuis TaxID=148309 RepID=A0AAD5MXN1_PARTN|nr:hypothetical protein KIN20_013481 [Parelaphostrongylus tenuis]
MSIRRLTHRSVLILRGSDSLNLLQGLVTNDVRTVSPLKAIAALFLDVKGRIVDDVIISRDNGDILVECSSSNKKNLISLLEKYRMRKTVDIIESHHQVLFCTEEAENSFPDPRFSSFGRRLYRDEAADIGPDDDYHERRMECGIAEGYEELGGLLPFQVNSDFLNMLSLDKGCYIGQELTARTAHTGVIRRRILPFKCESPLKKQSFIMQDDKKVGEVISCGSGFGLALLSLSAFRRPLSASVGVLMIIRKFDSLATAVGGRFGRLRRFADKRNCDLSSMSTKHLRRMLQERERQEKERQEAERPLDDEEEEDEPLSRRTGPLNRFAALQDDDDGDEAAEKSEGSDENISERPCEERRLDVKTRDKRKTNKKGKNRREDKEDKLDDDQLLEKILTENRTATSEVEENEEHLGVAQLLKPDPRLFDTAAELKRALGKTFKESASSSNRSHNSLHAAGRIVKQKNTWPPIRNLGLSMELDREEGRVKWFKFIHNAQYEELERLCWVVEDEKISDPGLIEEILAQNPYHLNSLILLANVFRMQEDITQSCDMIERGIFYCEQCMSSSFQVTSFYHRMDYLDYENRAFYLLLHRHMMNSVHKRCFQTALNYAKLILKMDPQKDPLAVLLLIDTIAIKGKQYKWFKEFYQCCREWKNLDALPNFCYSAALAQFLDAKTDDDFDVADQMLTRAICAFPGVISMLLDKLQIEPDPLVESHRHLGTFALNKETDGIKLVYKIYVNEAAELWKTPETLSWLEHVTRSCVEGQCYFKEMESWREKRRRLLLVYLRTSVGWHFFLD